jgi:hypothetical protein
MANPITVETEPVRRCREARERFEAGRAVGVELAAVTAGHTEIADAFLLDLPADAPYGTQTGQPTEADWDWYLTH